MKILRIIRSTLAAMIGIQNKKNLIRDLSEENALPFIVSGIIFSVLFVLTIIIVVNLIV